MSSTNKTILVFIGGVLTGAALGLLFAPDTGKNTRDKLSYKLDKYLGQLKAYLEAQAKSNTDLATTGDVNNPTFNQSQDYRKAEELFNEVQSLLDELKNKS